MTMQEQTPEKTQAPTCTPSWDEDDPVQQEISLLLKPFKRDLMGIFHLGTDGIMRSLTADRTILSAAAMSAEQIETFHARFPEDYRKQLTHLEGVDGTKTPKEKWFHPDDGILPDPLPQEKIEQTREMSEERKELMRARLQEDPLFVDVSGVLA